MKVKLWGTRGSIPVPGDDTVVYGGNTTCIEVRLNDGNLIIFDAGTGIRKLGLSLADAPKPHNIHLVLTHTHWDHIQGFPFFEPSRDPEAHIKIMGCPKLFPDLETIFTDQMEFQFFPLKFSELKAKIDFEKIRENGQAIGNARLYYLELNHPGVTYGFKIVEDGKSFAFLTDNELTPPQPGKTRWETFVQFCKNTDLLVHDAMWTNGELVQKAGWGHSSIAQVIQLAKEANVKQAVFTHYLPERTDAELEAAVKKSMLKNDAHLIPAKFCLAREEAQFKL